ncbi:MAG: glycosyltransferase family 39 protein [Nanoarchaeota archaeon]|nr:glycosyltransferase family 39 protein [Nanoarchaeota archaeon]
MNKSNIKKFKAKHYQIVIVICFLVAYFLIQLIGLRGFYSYGWDESVYLHMSNYFKSGGDGGFIENLRPILFSIILIPFSHSIFISRLFILVLSVFTLWIFYLIGKKNLNSEFSWVFPVVLAFFPFYYLSSNSILTEIVALFFHALCVYYFFRKKYVFSGLLAMLAFFTRFQFGIYFPILLFGIFLIGTRKNISKNVSKFILGILIGSPLFFINTYLFYSETNSFFLATVYPLLNQLKDNFFEYLWYYKQGFFYYLKYLLNWSIFSMFAIIGILFLIFFLVKSQFIKQESQNKWLKRNLLLLVFLLIPFSYLLFSSHKEIRYLMLVIPWIVYFICFGLIETIKQVKNKLLEKNTILTFALVFIILIVFLGSFLLNSFLFIKDVYHAPKAFYDNYLFALQNLSHQNLVLTSFPMIKTYAKIEIGYYNDLYFYEMLSKGNYDYVYYTYNWFPCQENDIWCLNLREDTMNYLENNFDLYTNYSLYGSDFFLYYKV